MPNVLAIAAHPDDIEFVMSGTMLQLAARGWTLHYFNLANGCYGSNQLDREQSAAVRLGEAQAAAAAMPATFYPPICGDMEIFYNPELHARVASVVRQVQPTILLTHAPIDYMEDHQNAARLAAGAAFVRSMSNFITDPPHPSYDAPLAIYHAQPHGNRDPLGNPVTPTYFVDVTEYLEKKRHLLSLHASRGSWLDMTQALASYLDTMEQFNAEVGQWSGRFALAEGWRRHHHLGYSPANFDPLRTALSAEVLHCGEVT